MAFGKLMVAILSIISAALYAHFDRNAQIDPLPTLLPDPPKAEGLFTKNTLLQGLEKIGAGLLPGPEDVAVDSEGRLYTGCADGWIKRIYPHGKVENWTYVGGHPLGLAFGIHGELLVCEPSMGLLNITEDHGVRTLSDMADGLKYKLADELAVTKDGTIYFTDASAKFGMNSSSLDILEFRPTGRLLKYDPATAETTVVLRNLYFANGIALSAKQDFLVFCETAKVRCQKYWLQGPKKGTPELFIDNLPGFPDNIHHNGKDTFWIALVATRSASMEKLQRISAIKWVISHPKLVGIMDSSSSRMAKILGVKEDGNIVAFLEDPNGKSIAFVTTALQVGGDMYLGNLARDYIGKLNIASFNLPP